MRWLIFLLAFGWAMEITDGMKKHAWQQQCENKDVTFLRALLGDGRPPDDRWTQRFRRGACPDGSPVDTRRTLGDRLQIAVQVIALQVVVVTAAIRWIYHWQPRLLHSLGMTKAR